VGHALEDGAMLVQGEGGVADQVGRALVPRHEEQDDVLCRVVPVAG
jgi:hypothetical protein